MKRFLTLGLALAFCVGAGAQVTPHWLRRSSISPDGETVAFAWQGDIFTVSAKGGMARQLTTNAAYDSEPIWSADGSQIVFSSTRELSKDIWVMPAEGGTPRRLTSFSGAETPLTTSADGYVWFSANIQPDPAYDGFPGSAQLYKVALSGGRPVQVTSLPVSNVSVNAAGEVLYEDYKGYEDALRKHHTSSVTRDIWIYKPATGSTVQSTATSNTVQAATSGKASNTAQPAIAAGSFTKLSSFEGEDRNPVWAADGRSFYFISEKSGVLNVWKGDASEPGKASQVTELPTHPVRNLSISRDGTLLFSYNGDLYTCKEGGKPEMLAISIRQDKNDRDVIRRNIFSGARAIAVSPSGKEVALVAHGDVYVTNTECKSTRRLTDTPEQERGVSFSGDGRSVYYASERDGNWAIWKCSLKNKEDKYMSLGYDFEEELFSAKGETCFQPAASPDGKWVAYLRDRSELVIKATRGGEEKSLLKGANYSYSDGDQEFEWCPDSRHILVNYEADGGWNNGDIAMIDIESGEVTNLTRSGYSDGGFRWAMKGHAMTWSTDKNGYRSHGSWGAERDVYAMFFDGKTYSDFARSEEEDKILGLLKDEKEAKKEEKKEAKDSVKAEKGKADRIEMELDKRDDRTVRLTRISGTMGDHYLTPDGTKLYYCMRLERSMDLCCLDIKKGSVKVVEKGIRGGFVPDKEGKNLYYIGLLSIYKLNVDSGKSSSVSFSSEYDYKPAAERAYIFEHCWKQVDEKFYDTGIHGLDWKAMHDNYAQFLPYINNNYDFQDMLSEMLGELNGSHTGARYRPGAQLATGHIGVLFDMNWSGEGLKIAEVLPGSGLELAMPEVKAGDTIVAIDGKKIAAGTDWYDALWMKANKRVQLCVKHDGKERSVYVTPTGSDQELLYKRWVRQREQMVQELSGGRIGYVHVKGMDSDSFREVYSKALGRYRNCDALIVDTRHNGGGWLHDDLATFLSGKAYLEFRPRGQYIGTEPYSKWVKPSCVLMGEDNYSDACGFPYTYRALGIGKLIGAPVPGTMTAVWWETQVDNTLVFGIPQVTSWGLKENRPLENYQIEPDIRVDNAPGEVLKGIDSQLEAAVREMMK